MRSTRSLAYVCRAILNTPIPSGRRARLIAISGIDSSGKGYVASQIAQRLGSEGERVALINVDSWLQLPAVRFCKNDPGRHFYQNAFRFDQMFSELIDPLARDGAIDMIAKVTAEIADDYSEFRYFFTAINTVLLEGIFLFRRDLRYRYDLKLWVDCSFTTALERAVVRAQEGLGPEDTVTAFRTIYFPAQEVHLAEDDPLSCVDLVFQNDTRP